MSFYSWLRNGNSTQAPRGRAQGRPAAPRFRPCLESLEDRLAPANFQVINTNDMGPGSLRQAIINANAAVGPNTIFFSIQSPGGLPVTITPASPLPAMTRPTTIAGETEPGSSPGVPVVELAGTGAGASANGLVLKAAGCVVRGLVIDRFGGNGILVLGSNDTVQGCYIGAIVPNTPGAGNRYYGVLIAGTATGVHIGTGASTGRNVIGDNGLAGVGILGSATAGNHVTGNFIGTDVTGNVKLGNHLGGVLVGGGSKNNVIGGTTTAAGNVISGNIGAGVEITDAGTTGNQVQGNRIGTDATGTAALGNTGDGVLIGAGAAGNTVAGATGLTPNVISGNGANGVEITGAGTTGNVVKLNRIGADLVGTASLANTGDGVLIGAGAASNTVGGTAAGFRAGNLIAGNGATGVRITDPGTTGNQVLGNLIGTDATGTVALGNVQLGLQLDSGVLVDNGAKNNVIGGTTAGAGNIISGNGGAGITISGVTISLGSAGTTGNLVQGNLIGTNAAGTAALANAQDGVEILDADDNTVGGTVAGARNVISGNGRDGVLFEGASGDQVQGNLIGTNAAGTAAVANGGNGVHLIGAPNNTVGGTAAGAGNLISGNGRDGVLIDSSGHNLVQRNRIGTNAAGTASVPNSQDGVVIQDFSSTNTVGGTAAGAGNLISGNGRDGVLIDFAGGNLLQGNRIGTNAAGTASVPNFQDGVVIQDSSNGSTVGGTADGARNVISGNGRFGVEITDSTTIENQVQGNFIGLAADGITALGNRSHGVFITAGANNNTIGGTTAGAGNRIAHNGGSGVLIGSDPQFNFVDLAGNGNTVEGNSIFANARIGIDLGPNDGPTPNDPNDTDTGPNNLLNTPVLTSAFLSGTSLFLTGFINTQTFKTLRIEFFANAPGEGQGQTFLGFVDVSTGPNNTVAFAATFTVPVTVLAGQTITATATDKLGNTSEFSLPLTIE